MDIEALFRSFDGKSVEPFRKAAAGLPPTQGTLHDLVIRASDGGRPMEIGSTWVLKHLLENGVTADESLAPELQGLLSTLNEDEARLHVLQCLPHVDLDVRAGRAAALFGTLLGLKGARNAFVRAWAYNALGLLAARSPGHRARVENLFAQAADSESAAVRARIRHASRLLAKHPR